VLFCLMTGCGGGSSTSASSSSTNTVSSGDMKSASAATASEVATSAAAFTTSQSASADTVAMVRGNGIVADGLLGQKTLGCGVVTVNATNAEGEPTNETITYALPACQFTGIWGLTSLSLTGTRNLALTDGTGFNFTSTDTNLEWSYSNLGLTSTETRNGTRQITASATSASIVNAITTLFSNAAGEKGTFTNDMTLNFTPVSGSELAAGQALPDGTLQASGSVSWQGPVNTDNFTVTTVTPLAYQASCVPNSASAFASGELKVTATENGSTAYGTVTWSNCGAPTVVVF
jgi:hypothetical protein